MRQPCSDRWAFVVQVQQVALVSANDQPLPAVLQVLHSGFGQVRLRDLPVRQRRTEGWALTDQPGQLAGLSGQLLPHVLHGRPALLERPPAQHAGAPACLPSGPTGSQTAQTTASIPSATPALALMSAPCGIRFA